MKKVILIFSLSLCAVAFVVAQSDPLQTQNDTFRQEGLASWYGAEFAGRPTASGEIFDPNQYTAAHPSLPFGTVLTVTNLMNRRQIQVRVNDRGPFVSTRIIDVSRAAAEQLDIIRSGTAQVLIELLPSVDSSPNSGNPVTLANPDGMVEPVFEIAGAATPTQIQPIKQPLPPTYPSVTESENRYQPTQPIISPNVVSPEAASLPESDAKTQRTHAEIIGGPVLPNRTYRLQVGSFKVPRNAVEAFDRLSNAGLNPSWEPFDGFYRIVLSNIKAEDVPSIAIKLKGAGFNEAIARLEKYE
ncbi:MAG: septal ring lytic transglycosylase RlpA family protein [Spirochaetaceae bacterium]|jgi:rare lipoprotein A|nr:septal ring lytic transglycosylase RlpA family protein [Spirochaetaceae bacterium]